MDTDGDTDGDADTDGGSDADGDADGGGGDGSGVAAASLCEQRASADDENPELVQPHTLPSAVCQ
jgi:hypothetical protein